MVEKELDRILTLLRNKIRERGFTQLEVQDTLGWGRSYISQLLTKQKSLRVEQVLLILSVIGVDPADFFSELYHFVPMDLSIRNLDEYAERPRVRPMRGMGFGLGMRSRREDADHLNVNEVRGMLHSLVQLLVDKQVIEDDELTKAIVDSDVRPSGGSD